LQRLVLGAFGDDPANWFAAGLTPGSSNILNTPPLIDIVTPIHGTILSQPIDLTLRAEASDSDGMVIRVEYFAGDIKLGEVAGPPFEFIWTNATFGSHQLTARATDNRQATTLSAPIAITILARPPTVSITSPTNGTRLLSGSPNPIVAAAIDVDGFIAKVEFYAGASKLGEASVAPYIFNWTNATPGHYTLTALATDDAGFTVLSAPVNVSVIVGSTEEVTLVSTGTAWKFFDRGMDLATAWRAPGFADAAWPSGPAPLGYGDGDEATTNNFGPDTNNKFVTTYFRHSFDVIDAAGFGPLNLRVLRDDGAVVYLNGSEVFRSAMPSGPIGYNTYANVTAVGGDESTTFYATTVSPALLVEGVNVLAVEIHQVTAGSSDLSFDLEFTGRRTLIAPVLLINAAGEITWPSTRTGFVLEVADTLTSPLQWTPADVTGRTEQNDTYKLSVPLTGPTKFYRLARP
jgi:hypothetical protein